MPLTPWKKLTEEIITETPYWSHAKTTYELSNGKRCIYDWIKADHGIVGIIAIDNDGKLALVQQYRPMADTVSLECPMGGIKDDQTPLAAARAELAEEAGLGAEYMEYIGKYWASIGSSNKVLHLFVAHSVYPEQAEPDDTEEFEQVRMSVDEFESAIQRGEIHSGLVLAAWAMARPKVLAIIDQLRRRG